MKMYIYLVVILLCSVQQISAQAVLWTKFQTYDDRPFNVYSVPQTSLIYLNAVYSSIALMDTKTGEIVNQFKNVYKPHNDWWRSGDVITVNSMNTLMLSKRSDTLILWSVKGNDSIIQSRKSPGLAISSGDGERVFFDSLKNADTDDLVILQTENLRELKRLPLSKDRAKLIANKNGSMIAYLSKTNDRKLSIISTETGQVLNTIIVDFDLHSLRFSNDGESIIAYHTDKLVRHKIIGAQATVEKFPYKNYGDLSPDEKMIAYNGTGGIVLYNLQEKTIELIPANYNYGVLPTVRFNGDGSSVLIGDDIVIVVDLMNKKISHTLTVPQVGDNMHVFNNNTCVNVSSMNSIDCVLDVKTGNIVAPGSGIGSRNSPISVIPIVKSSSSAVNKLLCRNVETGDVLSKEIDYEPHEQRTVVSDNGKLAAVATNDSQTVVLYNTENLEEISRIKIDLKVQDGMKLEMVRYLQFFNNDTYLGIITGDNYFVFSMDEKKIVKQIPSDNYVPSEYSLRRYITDDGSYLLTFSSDDNINLVDTETGDTKTVWNHKQHPESYSVKMLKWIDNTTFGLFMDTRFSNNDTLFVVRNDGTIVEKYPVETNNRYIQYQPPFECIFDKDSITMFVSITPRRLVSRSQRRVVRSVVDVAYLDRSSIKTYPQPSNDEITIELKNNSKACDVSVHTLTGEEVFHLSFEPTDICTFSTKNIMNGVFFLRITLSSGETLTQSLHVIH